MSLDTRIGAWCYGITQHEKLRYAVLLEHGRESPTGWYHLLQTPGEHVAAIERAVEVIIDNLQEIGPETARLSKAVQRLSKAAQEVKPLGYHVEKTRVAGLELLNLLPERDRVTELLASGDQVPPIIIDWDAEMNEGLKP